MHFLSLKYYAKFYHIFQLFHRKGPFNIYYRKFIKEVIHSSYNVFSNLRIFNINFDKKKSKGKMTKKKFKKFAESAGPKINIYWKNERGLRTKLDISQK